MVAGVVASADDGADDGADGCADEAADPADDPAGTAAAVAVSRRNATTSPTCGSEQSANRTSVIPTLLTVNEVTGRPSATAPVTRPMQSPTVGALDRIGAYGCPGHLDPGQAGADQRQQ